METATHTNPEAKEAAMTTQTTLAIARKHLGAGTMESSARLSLTDAVALYDNGDHEGAKARALKSIAYSVGVFHPDYKKASR